MNSRYPLNIPASLKQDAAILARKQGVSLNQFFLWSISEKVAELKTDLSDPRFPTIAYRIGDAGIPTPVIRGTGVRVETLVISHKEWQETAEELARDYEIPVDAVREAMSFYEIHKAEVDTLIQIDQDLEQGHGQA